MKKARAMYIPAGGKKAVWGPIDQNVLPEGYPYKEQSETVVLAEETVTPSALGERYMGALSVVPSLEVGKEYVVYFDGVRYTATAFEHSYGQGSPVIMLTDTGTATSNNWDVQVMGSYAGVMTNSPDAYTFSIYEMTETIHQMAPEFLPEGVVKTVVLTSSEYMNALSGVAPALEVPVTYHSNTTFEEAMKHIQKGGVLEAIEQYVHNGVPVNAKCPQVRIEASDTIVLLGNEQLSWTASGVTLG